jgi:hypothetical protein
MGRPAREPMVRRDAHGLSVLRKRVTAFADTAAPKD